MIGGGGKRRQGERGVCCQGLPMLQLPLPCVCVDREGEHKHTRTAGPPAFGESCPPNTHAPPQPFLYYFYVCESSRWCSVFASFQHASRDLYDPV